MTIHLQHLISEAQALSPQEQVELINAVSQFLRLSDQQPFSTTDFWQPQSIEQLAQAQAVSPVEDITQLVFDEESEDETADEMVAYIYGQREADRLRAA
jgi:hypothetical protein